MGLIDNKKKRANMTMGSSSPSMRVFGKRADKARTDYLPPVPTQLPSSVHRGPPDPMNSITWTSVGSGWVQPVEAPAGNPRPGAERGGVFLPHLCPGHYTSGLSLALTLSLHDSSSSG